MRNLLLSCGFLALALGCTYAQNPFRTRQSGNWNDPNTWEEDAGGGFAATLNTPTSASGTIAIRNTHTVTVTADVTIDQTTVQSGGVLQVSPSFTLTVADGSGDDLSNDGTFTLQDDALFDGSVVNVNGQLTNTATINLDNSLSSLNFLSGSLYRHARDGGQIPLSNWNASSTCEVSGVTATAPGQTNQNFGNFNWNCPGQTGNVTLLSAGTVNLGGSITISNSGGTPRLLIFSNTNGTVINISGNFNVTNAARFAVTQTGNPVTLNVSGNYVHSSTGSSALAGGTSVGILNVNGNFQQSAGLLRGTTGSSVNFTGSGVQFFTGGGGFGTSPNSANFSVSASSILDMGTSALTGDGSLTVSGTIRVGATDAAGAIQAGTTNGNVRVSGDRTYNTGSTIVYNGAGAQFMGSGHPSASNTQINNASGVTLASDQTVNGTLTLTSGNLNLGSNTLTIGSTFTPNSNFLGVISTSSLVINGTGAFGNLAITGGPTINNFTLNRGSGGSVSLVSDLTVNGTFTQTNGDLNLNGNTLRISGNYNRTSGNKIGSSTSSIIVDGSGTFSGTLGIVSPLNTLTINRTGSSVVTGSAFTLTNLNLLNGTFTNGGTITMASGGAVVTRNAGVLANPLAAASSYDVVYSNSSGSTVNTGPELPTNSTDLRNLTINSSDPVNLNANVTINGSLTFTTGIFNAGTNSIDLKGNLVSNNTSQLASSSITFSGNTTVSGSTQVVFGGITVTGTLTPTSALQINGNLVNNGTLNAGSSTVTFGGTTAISGSSVSSFNNVVINNSSSLTAPAGNLNVAGNWTNNGMFTDNGGTITFTGTTSISGSSATNFGGITISGTLNSPSTLNVSRDFTNNGTFNSGSGTVVFNGSSTQSIQGSTTTNFNNITVTNTAGPPAVRVQTNQNLAGVLTLGANSIFDADGSGNSSVFTLLSTNDATTADASIATLPSGAAVTGNVTVQRFMAIEGANSNRIYRYISSPVQAAAVSQIQNFIPVTGGFTGASSCSGCGTAQSMFAFNETLTNGNLSAGYINFPSASNAETLTAGRGYAMFVRGNIAPVSSAGSARWAVTGSINSGTINFNAFTTFTVDGWNLVGNPYPSTIDWDAAGWTRTNVNNAVHMLDNGLTTPVYATYISGASTNGGTRFIPTGQAFFVRTTAGGVNFQATEAVKVAGTQTTFFRQETAQNELRLTLSKPGVRDEALIRLKSGSTENFDNNYDAMKLKNGTSANPVISLSSFSSDNKDLVINSVGTSFCSESFNARLIPLNVDRVIPGAHTLSFSQLDTFTEDLTFVLRDLFTKDSLIITPSSSSYQFSVTPDPKSYGNGRFVLACNCNGRITESKEPSIRDVRVFPNPTESIITIEMPYSENSISASVYDNLGSWVGDVKLGKAGELLTGNFDMSSAANGMYFVRVSANGKVLTKKVIKK